MNLRRLLIPTAGLCLLAACAKEPPPRTLSEFLDDPVLLEAALVRCDQNRAESRYEAECVNAREAVKIIEAKEEAKRREELEAQSQRKREALRRTQAAAAEARRRVAEAERLRREQEYLEQFGELPPDAVAAGEDAAAANAPGALIPEPEPDYDATSYESRPPPVADYPPADEPESDVVPEPAPQPEAEPETDLQSVRDELRRRNEDGQN
ncbi:MAG: EexN family lipoprotein [Woeseiaceae bacterium]|nr:EexN family lipoprotein [Woeseiaceae bacterium]